MIRNCDCKHDFQDKKYGKGNRVHTYGSKKNNGNAGHACTVCGKIKPA